MTPKERLLAVIKGKNVDRVPWSPFLAYYWEAQPKEIQKAGQLAFYEAIGADPLFRGSHLLFKKNIRRCQTYEKVSGNEKRIIYETPVGNLYLKYVLTEATNSWFLVEHPVKTKEDFKILTFINENMDLIPDFEGFIQEYANVGERGLILPVIGPDVKTSFQSLIEHWVGTEELVYALADYPDIVEETLHAMRKNAIASTKISVHAPAEAYIFFEDSSTTNISPGYFEKYSLPEISEWVEIIHKESKYLIHHACGHIKDLLSLMAKSGIDMIESISPPPTGNIELWEARKMLPENIGLIGGIEPTVFLNSSLKQLEEYVYKLLSKMKGTRYILANSDSCPPGVELEKFRLVTSLVRNCM